MEKPCKKCGLVKSLEEFYRASGMKDGRRNDCIPCNNAATNARNAANPQANRDRVRQWRDANRDRYNELQRRAKQTPEAKARDRAGHLRRKFGLTLADYDRMLERQGGGCAICHGPPPEGISFHVDHDPIKGAVRALLCVRCNNGLGQFKDDDELLEAAIDYLRRTRIEIRLRQLKAMR